MAGTGAGLIAMGVRNQGLLRSLFSGNVAGAVLRGARVHILIVPQSDGAERPPLFARLLVPTDLSVPAPEVRSLIETPAGDGAAVLLHVVEQGRTEQEAGARLTHLRESLVSRGGEVRVLVRTGNPARTICAVADEIGASAVVIPRIGKRDAAGSATGAVVECVRRPILVLAIPVSLQD